MGSKDMKFLLALAVVSALCATMVSSSREAESTNLNSLVSDDELDEARLFTSALLASGDSDTTISFTGWEWALLFTSIILLTALFSALLSGALGGGGGDFAESFAAPTAYAPAPSAYAQPAPVFQSTGFDSSYAVARQLEEAQSKYDGELQ